MNPNRMLSIIMFLLTQKRYISLSELSKIFGITTRTIYRDIDVMREAGIPLTMLQGEGGGSIALGDEFAQSLPDTTDIVDIILAVADLYPKLLESKAYALAQYRRLAALHASGADTDSSTAVRVTLRFNGRHRHEISALYDLKITSQDEDGTVTADIYLPNSKGSFDALFLLGDKCRCVEPRHVREHIKSKLEAIVQNYQD